jgi:hypothetical protein
MFDKSTVVELTSVDGYDRAVSRLSEGDRVRLLRRVEGTKWKAIRADGTGDEVVVLERQLALIKA